MNFTKRDEAILDYTFDWEQWLNGDIITDFELEVTSGITVQASSNTSTKVIVWLSGGSAGSVYTVNAKITTQGGRVDERNILIKVVS